MATTTRPIEEIPCYNKRADQGLVMVDASNPDKPILHYVVKSANFPPATGDKSFVKCWLDNGKIVYVDSDGNLQDDPNKKIVVAETSIQEEGYKSSSTTTRGEEGSSTTTEQGIDKLNARETIAMNVMVSILKTMNDPIGISNTAIDMLVNKSFTIAQTFLDKANSKRVELGENVSEQMESDDPIENISIKLESISKAIAANKEIDVRIIEDNI